MLPARQTEVLILPMRRECDLHGSEGSDLETQELAVPKISKGK
jgi:hypothetical protein